MANMYSISLSGGLFNFTGKVFSDIDFDKRKSCPAKVLKEICQKTNPTTFMSKICQNCRNLRNVCYQFDCYLLWLKKFWANTGWNGGWLQRPQR